MTSENNEKKVEKNWTVQVLGGVAIILLLAVLGGYFYVENREDFLSGVYIGGTDISGLSPEAATVLLEENIEKELTRNVEFYIENETYTASLKEYYLPFDASEIVKTVWQAEKKRPWWNKLGNLVLHQDKVYPLGIQENPEAKARLKQEWEEKYNREPVNAFIEIDSKKGLLVIPEKNGITVDVEATLAQLPENLKKLEERYEIIHEKTKPEIVSADLQNMAELGSYTTKYNTWEVSRSHNLEKAANIINAKMVPSGEVFSFNGTVGKRSAGAGYLDALIINNGRFEPGLGGGICQVSSTLYNAALLSGMDIVERYNHNLAVAYVPLGLDATVVYGVQDLKFKNNTDAPVYIQFSSGGGQLTAIIYGDVKHKQKIELYSVVDRTIPFATVEESNPEMAPGSKKVVVGGGPGYEVRSYRKFLDADGKVVRQEQLGRDVYRPLNRVIEIGPTEGEEGSELEPGPGFGPEPVPEGEADNAGGSNTDNDNINNTGDNSDEKTNDISSEMPPDLVNLENGY